MDKLTPKTMVTQSQWLLLIVGFLCINLVYMPSGWADNGELLPPGENAVNNAAQTSEAIETQARPDSDLVSISVTNGRIQDVLLTLANMRPGTTIMIDPDVSGEVTFELQDIPWETALQLVAESHGLQIIQRSENIYRAQRMRAAPVEEQQDLVVELFTSEEIERLSDRQLTQMFRAEPGVPMDLTVEEMREEALANPDHYVKRLSVIDRRAIEVINQLGRQSNVDFVFSTHMDQPAREPGQPQPPQATVESPPISLNVRNRPLPVVLRLIANQGGLSITSENDIWVVKPLRPEQRALEPLITQTFRVRYIPVDEKLVSDLRGLASDRGRIIARDKTLTVFDTADRVNRIERIINDQDIPTPQVLIEARFFVLNDTTSHELGINWQTLTEEDGGISFSSNFADLTYEYYEQGRVLDPRIATLGLPQLTAVLHALDGMDKAEQLSNPKILVSSGEQATIHIGRQEPILRSTVDTSGDRPVRTFELDTNFGGETVRVADLLADRPGALDHSIGYSGYTGYLDLGTKLTVAPLVKTENEVYIRVIPELINKPSQIVVGEDAFQQTFPVLFRVRVQTQFNLISGQTVAIGGLVSEDTENIEKAVPGLSKIPFLGRLFRYNSERQVRSETIIFLTVRIISPDQLNPVSGIPVNARQVQAEIDNIRIQDAEGGIYNEYRGLERLRYDEAQQKFGNFFLRTEPVLPDRPVWDPAPPRQVEPMTVIEVEADDAPIEVEIKEDSTIEVEVEETPVDVEEE